MEISPELREKLIGTRIADLLFSASPEDMLDVLFSIERDGTDIAQFVSDLNSREGVTAVQVTPDRIFKDYLVGVKSTAETIVELLAKNSVAEARLNEEPKVARVTGAGKERREPGGICRA